jgi:hypothetical protein
MKIVELEECYGSKTTACYINENVEIGDFIWYKGLKWVVIKIK